MRRLLPRDGVELALIVLGLAALYNISLELWRMVA